MSKLTISKDSNPNYLSKVIQIKGLQKHSNADKLQIVVVDFQTVITGMDTQEGDIYVYFPIESKINKDFLSFTNSFRESKLNKNPEVKGFFEENCRVKAMRLRGEKSMGYIVPIQKIIDFAGSIGNIHDYINAEFDTVNGVKIVEKYVIKERNSGLGNTKTGKSPQLSRLVEGQVHLHVDTENLRKNSYKISPNDIISVTYKTHGTSFWVGNVKVLKRLTFIERLLKRLGVDVVETEYDLVYGSRNVVKNKTFEDPKGKNHFYGYDLWNDIKNEIGEFIPKGFTLYGECLGYTKTGSYIQDNFDYGCKVGEKKIEIYRITNTNEDGLVTELTYPEIVEFCGRVGLTPSHLFYYGKAGDMYPNIKTDEHWNENFVLQLEKDYNEKDCFMCVNKNPEEGIVLRKEKLFSCESYKLKSFRFLENETKLLDKGVSDLESEN
jgi:hypothetical protein